MPDTPTPALFRYTLGHFASGVTVMTTCLGNRLHGMTVSAFCSVSLEPPMVLVCVEKVTVMFQLVSESRVYAVNFLSARDEAISRFFADDERLKVPEFATLAHHRGVTGSPILELASAYVEAGVRASYDGGDHVIFLGEVVALEVRSENLPLIFYRGGYTTIKSG